MRKLLYIILFTLSSSAFSCEEISIINLIATPDKYINKCISTVGVFSLEFERQYIYLNQDSYYYALKENGIPHNFLSGISDDNTEQKFVKGYEGKVVRVKGNYIQTSDSKLVYLEIMDVELIRKATRYFLGDKSTYNKSLKQDKNTFAVFVPQPF